MVFFTCNTCGDSIKKAQVEKHYQTKCRNCDKLSCVDCGKDFWGEEYKGHNKCMSEDQKYGGKNYKPKAGQNKGEAKQELWVEQVQAAVEKVKTNPRLKEILIKVIEFPNIPRKKAKFENFLKNSLRIQQYQAVQAWDAIETEVKLSQEQKVGAEIIDSEPTDGVSEVDKNETEDEPEEKKLSKRERKEARQKKNKPQKKKAQTVSEEEENSNVKKGKKKRKLEETVENGENVEENEADDRTEKKRKNKKMDKSHKTEKMKKKKPQANENLLVERNDDEPSRKRRKSSGPQEPGIETNPNHASDVTLEDIPQQNGKFRWEDTIVQVLSQAGGQLPLKKLKRKVLSAYAASECDGHIKSQEQLYSKFNKKLKKNMRFSTVKEHVKLVR